MAAGADRGDLTPDLGQQGLPVAHIVEAIDQKILGHPGVDQVHHRAGVEEPRFRHLQLRDLFLKWGPSIQKADRSMQAQACLRHAGPAEGRCTRLNTTLSLSAPAITVSPARPISPVPASACWRWKKTPSPVAPP